jgi:hypothetical protein
LCLQFSSAFGEISVLGTDKALTDSNVAPTTAPIELHADCAGKRLSATTGTDTKPGKQPEMFSE